MKCDYCYANADIAFIPKGQTNILYACEQHKILLPGFLEGAKSEFPCEVCGYKGMHVVRDLQEIEPLKALNGSLWKQVEIHSVHIFCEKHNRLSIEYPRKAAA